MPGPSESDSDYDAYGAPSDEERSEVQSVEPPNPQIAHTLSILEGKSSDRPMRRRMIQRSATVRQNPGKELRRSATLGPSNEPQYRLRRTPTALTRANTTTRHVSNNNEQSNPVLMRQRSLGAQHASTINAFRNMNLRTVAVRVFLLDMQRYIVVNVLEDATAVELLDATLSKAQIGAHNDPFSEWAIYDIFPDFGLERPLRQYERIAEVQEARCNDEGSFVLKGTDFGALLNAHNVPMATSTIGGWVSLQTDPKTCTNRWLELREYAVFSAKSERVSWSNQGKGEVRHCSMMDTELYLVDESRAHAKQFAFALRSVHGGARDLVFASQSDQKAHQHWVKSITSARTYVLRQERPELFLRPKAKRSMSPHAYSSNTAPRVLPQTRTAPLVAPESLSVQFQKGSLLANISRQ